MRTDRPFHPITPKLTPAAQTCLCFFAPFSSPGQRTASFLTDPSQPPAPPAHPAHTHTHTRCMQRGTSPPRGLPHRPSTRIQHAPTPSLGPCPTGQEAWDRGQAGCGAKASVPLGSPSLGPRPAASPPPSRSLPANRFLISSGRGQGEEVLPGLGMSGSAGRAGEGPAWAAAATEPPPSSPASTAGLRPRTLPGRGSQQGSHRRRPAGWTLGPAPPADRGGAVGGAETGGSSAPLRMRVPGFFLTSEQSLRAGTPPSMSGSGRRGPWWEGSAGMRHLTRA